VAASPCRVLVLSAEGLRRFGRRVRAPLAALAADRRDFLQQRRTAVHVSLLTGCTCGKALRANACSMVRLWLAY
jgi:hypothetical protein